MLFLGLLFPNDWPSAVNAQLSQFGLFDWAGNPYLDKPPQDLQRGKQ